MSQIVEALRGDAAQVAMGIGTEELLRVGPGTTNDPGFKLLKESMRGMVFPFARAEAKLLYKSGHKKKGVLSQQPQESMVSYIA